VTHRRVLIVGERVSEVRLVDLDDGGMREAIGGGVLDVVACDGYRMYLDEEGDGKELFVNERAIALARALGYRGGAYFRGPIVFLGSHDGNVPGHVLGVAYDVLNGEIDDST
jgi:hypothetical protein